MASRLIPRAVRGTATPTSRPPTPTLRRSTTCTTSPNSSATTTTKSKRTPTSSRARHGIDHGSYPASRRRCWAVSRPKKSCFSTCYLRSGCRWPCWPTLGAIVFHIAERYAGLLPDDASARARAITWMFAALSTVEPPILELGVARFLEGDKPWSAIVDAKRQRGARPPPLSTSTVCQTQGLAASPGSCRTVPGRKRETAAGRIEDARRIRAQCGHDRARSGDRRRRSDGADAGGRAGAFARRRCHCRAARQPGPRGLARRRSAFTHHRGARPARSRGSVPLAGEGHAGRGLRDGPSRHQRLSDSPQLRARAAAGPHRAHTRRLGRRARGTDPSRT